MLIVLLCSLQIAFSLLVCAVATRFAERIDSKFLRRLTLAVAVVPLLAFHLLLAWKACVVRFDLGVEHAPWTHAIGVAVAHALGVAWILRARPFGANSTTQLAVAALIAASLETGLVWNLDLRFRLNLLEARVEAGRIAYEVGAKANASSANAGPIYTRIAASLFEGQDEVQLSKWRDALGEKAELDASDPELRAVLARCAAALDETRSATRITTCRFEPRDLNAPGGVVAAPPIFPLLSLAQLLQLEARVRLADRDVRGALEDVRALYRFTRHLADTRGTGPLMVTAAIARETHATLAHVLSSPRVVAGDLEGLEGLFVEFAPLGPDMVASEKAYGMSMLSMLADEDTSFTDSNALLEFPYFLSSGLEEIAGYRAVLDEQMELARGPLDALRRAEDDPARLERTHARGLIARVVAPHLAGRLIALRLADARNLLSRAALAAARLRFERGELPSASAELGPPFDEVQLTRDDDGLLFELADPSAFKDPPTLRLRPVSKS